MARKTQVDKIIKAHKEWLDTQTPDSNRTERARANAIVVRSEGNASDEEIAAAHKKICGERW